MDSRIKELIDLTTNYLFYSRIDTDKREFYYWKIIDLINKNINSYDDAIKFYNSISSINILNVRKELLRKLQNHLLKTEKLTTEEAIKLYFENDYFHYLNKRINVNELRKFLNNNSIEPNKIKIVFDISSELGFELLNEIKNHSIDLESYSNKITNKDEFIKLVSHFDALNPNTISSLINNSEKFSDIKIDHLYPFALDNNVSVLSVLPSNRESKEIILSKVNESLFKRSITDSDVQDIINRINLKEFDDIPNGLKINILKYSLTNSALSKEDMTSLLNNINDKSITFALLSKYDKDSFSYILREFPNKIMPKNLESLLNLKSIDPDTKNIILDYLISNDMFSNIEKYAKNHEISIKLFMSIIDSRKSYGDKFRIKNEYISKEIVLKILTDSLYYTQLDSMSLVFLLNTLNLKDMLKIVNDKNILSLLNSDDLAYLINLEIGHIIDFDNIFEYYNKELLLNEIENHLQNYDDLKFLLNKNISKLLFNTEDLLSKGDIESIKYLIDYTRNINRELTYLNVDIVKSYVGLYLMFGIEDSIELINLSNNDPSIKEIIKVKDRLLQAKINTFRMENAANINNAFNIIMYNLEKIDSLEELDTINNFSFNLFIEYSDKIAPLKAKQLLEKYITIKNDQNNKEDLKRIREEIREQLKLAINEFMNEKSKEYNKELTRKMKTIFRLKNSTIQELSQKYSKELIVRNMMSEFYVIMNSKNKQDIRKKEVITEIFRQKINLDDLCDYEYFENNVLLKILNSDFDKETFLCNLGYNKPNNFEQFVFNKKLKEEVKKINSLFSKNKDKVLIFRYLLGEVDILKNIKDYNLIHLIKEKNSVIKRFSKYLKFDGEKITYTLEKLPNEQECNRYNEVNMRINKISKEIFTIMQSVFTPQKALGISPEDLLDYFEGKIAINDKNYEIIKKPLKTKEISLLFSNFDFNSIQNLEISESIKKFVFDNIYNIRFLSDSENQYYVKNFGYILSHFDKLSFLCKTLDIDINNITIEEVKILQDYILLHLTPFGETIDKNIISKLINETDFVEIKEASKRVERGVDLLEASQRKTISTIPLLKSKSYEILDYHDPKNLISGMINSSCFRVGGTGNDFIAYCVLSKDGSVIFIKNSETEEVIGRISAVRRGNTYFMHQLQIDTNYAFDNKIQEMCESAIEELANDIINKTANTEEPIELVTITAYKKFEGALKDKEELTKKRCSYVVDPIDITTDDYKNYLSYPYLERRVIYKSFYHNYDACETIIVSQSKEKVITKDYSAKPIYLRERKGIETYDFEESKIDEVIEQKIRKILYLNYRKEYDKLDSERNSKVYDLSELKRVKLGEDWCILEYNNGKTEIINLCYDERSEEEINKFTESISERIM